MPISNPKCYWSTNLFSLLLLNITKCEKDKLNVNSLIPGQTASLWRAMKLLLITPSPLPAKLVLTQSSDNIQVHALRKWSGFFPLENTLHNFGTKHIAGITMKIIPYYFRSVWSILFNFLILSSRNYLISHISSSDRNAGKEAGKRNDKLRKIRKLLIAAELDSFVG